MKFLRRFSFLWVFTLFLSLVACAEKTKNVEAAMGVLSDEKMFTLTDTRGQETSLPGLLKQNRAVLLNFWATWCPSCREEIPDLIRLQEEFKNASFTVLGVDIGETPEKVSRFMTKAGINYPVVLDSDSAVTRAYGVVGIPTSFLISAKGEVLGEYHAATEELFQDVEKATNS